MKREAHVKPPLTDLENEVMEAVWDRQPASVEAVHQVVAKGRDIQETSVRTLLRRLEQKGYLRHEEQGRAYVYFAAGRAANSRSLAAQAVRQIIDRFCRGSVEELVSGMVDAKVLSGREMGRLEEFVRERKRKRGQ
jgi:predicted transcriptional regulator